MLIVAGVFEVDPSERDAFVEERHDMMRRSRDEAGCISYVFSADPVEPGRVYLFERWESKAALASHLELLRSDPPSLSVAVTSAEVLQYEISGAGPIGS